MLGAASTTSAVMNNFASWARKVQMIIAIIIQNVFLNFVIYKVFIKETLASIRLQLKNNLSNT